jgi:AraC-like DNA-binding protein
MSNFVLPSPYTAVSSFTSLETPRIELLHVSSQHTQLRHQMLSYVKLLFIEDGEGWCLVNHQKIQAKAGDILLIPPGEVYDVSGLENTKSWIVAFESQILAPDEIGTDIFSMQSYELLNFSSSWSWSKSVENKYFHVALADRPRWLARLYQLERELHGKSLEFLESARILLLLLIFDLAKLASPQLKQGLHQSKPLLKKVFDFIDSYYCNPISLLDVAKEVNLSPGYLTEIVRRETGLTVLNWITKRRMSEARRLLVVSALPVHEVASAVGYLDTGHFIRQFRRHHGKTPQTWRRAHQNHELNAISVKHI